MEYYSAIFYFKKNEIMSFAVTQMHLQKRKRCTDLENELTVARRKDRGRDS